MLKYLRYLRYPVAIGFALLAIALIGLWVRSYSWNDFAFKAFNGTRFVSLTSKRGVIDCLTTKVSTPQPLMRRWKLVSDKLYKLPIKGKQTIQARSNLGFGFRRNGPLAVIVSVPYWFLVTLSLGIATSLIVKRFTVRGLLISTTLLAAMLGVAVYTV